MIYKNLNEIKGLAVIFVVIAHSDSPFDSVLYLFHVPLFFFISGYLYKDQYSNKPVMFIKRRLKSLYVPFLMYQFFFLIFHNLLYEMRINYQLYTMKQFTINSVKNFLFMPSEEILGIFWFVPVLFFTAVSFCVIRYLMRKNQNENMFAFIITAIFLLGNLIIYKNFEILMKGNMNIVLIALPIFYSGYLFRYLEESGIKVYDRWLTFASFLFLIVSLLYGRISMVGNTLVSPHFFILSSLSGIYVTFFIGKKIIPSNELLAFIGKNSLFILALHFLIFKLVTFVQIKILGLDISLMESFPTLKGSSFSWWFIYSIMGLFVPLGIRWFYLEILKQLKKKRNE